MPQLPQIDELLKTATDRGDVPGVVAMATTREGPVYQGAFGRRALPDGAAMSADTVFWIASMTKAITSTAAMQLVEQGKLALDAPIAGVLPELAAPQVLEGFDVSRRAAASSGAAADHPAPPDHPHRRLCLRHMERGFGPLHGEEGNTRDHLLRERGAGIAGDLRSGRQMGLRHQHRLGRQGGRAGQRSEPWRLFRRAPVQTDRYEGYRLQIDPGSPRPDCRHALPERGRRPGADPVRDAAGTRIRDGRRWALRHRGGLSGV